MNILYITYTLNGLLMIILAVLLSSYLVRHFKTGWRLIWIGGATFILSQVGHIPFNSLLFSLFNRGILPTPPDEYLLIFNSILLGLSAGLWEEGANYITFRWWAKDARSWGKSLVLGSGHGGAEAIILGILALFTLFQMVALRSTDLSKIIPPEQLGLAQQQVTAFWSAPWYATLLGAVERAFTLVFHLSASVIILQVFTRRQIRWLFIAILWHATVDAVAVYAVSTWGVYITEGIIGISALISLGIIFALKTPEPEQTPIAMDELPPVKDAQSLPEYDLITDTPEKLDETRYN
jgi:uncharacterized membrane protein YhfC